MPTPPLVLPVAEYLPDRAAIEGVGSSNIRNVIPRTPESYGPFPGPSVYSSALASRCQGMAVFLDSSLAVNGFAGNATDLFKLTAGSPNWANVSKGAPGAYGIAGDQRWVFTLFGTRVIATDYADAIQSYQLGVSALFADLSAGAPNAKYLAVIRNFLMAANTNDGVNGVQPQRAWWATLNDPTSWPTPGGATAAAGQSSFNDLFGEGGPNMGIVGNLGNADGAIAQQHALWRVVYAGPPGFFDFFPMESVRGTPAAGSIMPLGNIFAYLGEDGFYTNDGASSTPIGANKVDKFFFDDVDRGNMFRIVSTADPVNKLLIWAYPGVGNVGGNPNHLLIWRWDLGRWAIVDVTVETIGRFLSFGYTLDQLYTVLGYTIDNLPFPLDSSVWTGGQLALAGFDTAHKLNFFNGPNLPAIVESEVRQPFPGRRANVRAIRPRIDGGTCSIAVATSDQSTQAFTYRQAFPMNGLGVCPARTSGRYIKAQLTKPVGDLFKHISGMEFEGTPAGFR